MTLPVFVDEIGIAVHQPDLGLVRKNATASAHRPGLVGVIRVQPGQDLATWRGQSPC